MKFICVGRNYAEHARELKNEVPGDPVIFMKPDTAMLHDNKDFWMPEFSQDIHYECEVIYRVAREGKHVQPRFALSYLEGVGIGIDFTARDLQTKLKEKSLPWTLAKGFNHSAPVSSFLPMDSIADHHDIRFRLDVNGQTRQQGHTADMIFPIEELIAFITRYITIKKGDIIFTGTPAGVGPVKSGDHLQGYLGDRLLLDFAVK